MTDDEIHAYCSDPENRIVALRILGDGRHLLVTPLLFGRATLGLVGDAPHYDYNAWQYENITAAIQAMLQYDPLVQKEPDGWFRHPATGRRREDGDPSKEKK